MSQYEYDTQEQYIDRFVSRHTVIIRGVNTEIGTEEAKKKTQKLFQQRFGKDQVLACTAIRKWNQYQKLYHKVKAYRKKLKELKN